jgi:hypothetical protein
MPIFGKIARGKSKNYASGIKWIPLGLMAYIRHISGKRKAVYTYFRHNVGVNSTKMVNTSSLPSSMAAEHTQVWKLFSTP